jgi:hypothetical protein
MFAKLTSVVFVFQLLLFISGLAWGDIRLTTISSGYLLVKAAVEKNKSEQKEEKQLEQTER